MLQRSLHHERRAVLHAVLRQLAGGDAVFGGVGTQQLRYSGVGHDKGILAAVGFVHGDGQVATVAGGEQVVDDERPRRYRGFVELVAVLGDADGGIAVGDTAHYRRIALLRLRQHAVVGGHGDTTQTHAVHDLAAGEAVAYCQLRLQFSNAAL